jgi:hypothetical protein
MRIVAACGRGNDCRGSALRIRDLAPASSGTRFVGGANGAHTALAVDSLAAKAMGSRGTPTVVVNGQRLSMPDSARLDGIVRRGSAQEQGGR